MKKKFKIILILIIIFVVIIGSGILYLNLGLKAGSKLDIKEINLSNVDDGTYRGTYNSGRWSNEIEITIKDHKITNIKIIDDVTFVQDGVSKELFNKVIEKQNTDVEVVSGATVTSKAYLKAIENALNE